VITQKLKKLKKGRIIWRMSDMPSVVGDAFVDITVPMGDIVPNGASNRNIKIAYGGTANIAVWASRYGEKVNFFGKVGNDALGISFKEDLKVEGVNDLTVIDYEYNTGICVSLVDEKGARTMITNRGANDNLSIQDVEEHIGDILASDTIFFTGYSFSSRKTSNAIYYLMNKVHKQGCEIWFNPGALNVINSKFKNLIRDYCDVLILNLEEGEVLTDKKNPEDIIENLKNLSEIVVLTMGDKGCIASDAEESIHVPARKVNNVLDTTGAGDAFSAGFLVGRLREFDLKERCKLAHEIATNVIQRMGAR
jgi:sugar/nucleoside kinase (ribokinase family)